VEGGVSTSNDPLQPEMRRKILDILAESEKLAANVLKQTGEYRRFFDRVGAEGIAELYRVLEFTSLVQLDIACLYADYLLHEDAPRAHVYARFLILTIYESTRTYRSLLGKRLQRKLSEQEGSVVFLQQVRAAHKELCAVSERADRVYGEVRNGVAAHRDEEAVMQLGRLREIGGDEFHELVAAFHAALNTLVVLLADFSGAVKQVVDRTMRTVFLPIGGVSTIKVDVVGQRSTASQLEQPIHLDWRSEDSGVATVSSSGEIRAVGHGSTRVWFQSPTESQIWGGAFVVVAPQEEIPGMIANWKSLFAAHEPQKR
jgi:hypothetical protein